MKLKEIYEAITSLERQRDDPRYWKNEKERAEIDKKIESLKKQIKHYGNRYSKN